MEPLMDVTPFVAMTDDYMALADSYIEKYWDVGFTLWFWAFGIAGPFITAIVEMIAMVFAFPVWAGMIFINGPYMVANIAWVVLLVQQYLAFREMDITLPEGEEAVEA